MLPFHANLLQAAISAPAPVLPAALRYVDGQGRHTRAVSYVGDESLAGSIWRTLAASGVHAVVRFGLAQQSDGRDRRAWARDLQSEVQRLHGRAVT